ncbi:MAG: ABC transporter substrate-binding protein [Bdellovibrionales bacterium]
MKNHLFAIALLTLIALPAAAQEATKTPIKIGELYPNTTVPDQAKDWNAGWKMALTEINAAGGVLGHPLAVISRDDKSSPSETIKALEEFKGREGIKIFFGTLLSHTSLAASQFAKQNHMLMVKGAGGSSKLNEEGGHNLYFQLGPPTSAWAGYYGKFLAPMGKKRWAIVSADYEMGRSIVAGFQREMKKRDPSVEFVETQWFPIGKLEAGATSQALSRAKPDALFAVMWGGDYARFVREAGKRGLFKDRLVISPICGADLYLRPLGKEAPVGWYSFQGFPAQNLTDPMGKAFAAQFKKTYDEWPYLQAFMGYSTLKILAEAISKAGSDDPDKVAALLRRSAFTIPSGTIRFRADGLSTLGEWVGQTGFVDGIPTIVNPEYIDVQEFLPSPEENIAKWKK